MMFPDKLLELRDCKRGVVCFTHARFLFTPG